MAALARRRDRELAAFMRASAGAEHLRPRGLSHLLLLVVVAFVVAFGVWASRATLDEVTRGDGRVIPSRQVQVVQNLEGGIVAAINAREGEVVDAGQVVMRIDNVRAASDFREKRARFLALEASAARLRAEIGETAVTFPPEVLADAPELAANEQDLFASRQARLQGDVDLLQRQVEQREQELAELRTRLTQLERSFALAGEELALTEPLAQKRVVARSDLLKLQREVSDLKGELEQTRLAVPRGETAVREANQRIAAAITTFRSDAQRDLNAVEGELAGLREVIVAGEDRVRRTEVRSPVRGTIKQIKVSTIGGVVQPGADLMEIVPLEDTLLVEAQVRPADIAFLRPGLPATVKITAYDYAIYGGLKGTVEDISADSIADDKGESFYRVRVRTERSHLGSDEAPLEIIPGMTAQISVLTGHRTVLQYLLKPLLRARERAFTER
ncbi:MAG: HlyD family type I secretion periplasmic adaptor subunit [Geminicoccaceae bacterium]